MTHGHRVLYTLVENLATLFTRFGCKINHGVYVLCFQAY